VADEKALEGLVEAVQRLPEVLVQLDARRQLAAALAQALGHAVAVPGRAHGLEHNGLVGGAHNAKGLAALDGVDKAQLVVLGRVLEDNHLRPVIRHKGHTLVPGHLIGLSLFWDRGIGLLRIGVSVFEVWQKVKFARM